MVSLLSLFTPIRKRLYAVCSLVPTWIWSLGAIVLGCLLYSTRGVNIIPLVVLYMLLHARVWDSMRAYWGDVPLRIAAGMTVVTAITYTFIMVFFHVENTMSVFWGDSTRVFEDFTTVAASHYRVKTHPLYVLICQTIYHLVAPASGMSGPVLRMLIVLCASINVGLFCLFSFRVSRSKAIAILSSSVLAVSYPMLYHGAMLVESFIFSQTTVIASMLYFQSSYEQKRYSFWMLMLLAIVTAGMNLGYAAIFGIMYVVLLRSCGMAWKKAMKSLVLFAVVFFAVFNMLMLVQFAFYGQGSAALAMPKTLIHALVGTAKEDVAYLNSNVSLEFFFGSHLPSYFSTVLFWKPLKYMESSWLWWEPLWAILLIIPVVRIRLVRQRSLFISLILVNLFLIMFHSVYGAYELPLYGPVLGICLLSLLPFASELLSFSRIGSIAVNGILLGLVVLELLINVPNIVASRYISDLFFSNSAAYTWEEMRDMSQELNRLGDELPSICRELKEREAVDDSTGVGSDLLRGAAAGDFSLELLSPAEHLLHANDFSFGLERRRKLIFENGRLIDWLTGDVLFDARGLPVHVEADQYKVIVENEGGGDNGYSREREWRIYK